jgi:hypothetical protein
VLATQTTGSIFRPAAFCGVVGYKPSHGTLPPAGVKAISESFDTVGVTASMSWLFGRRRTSSRLRSIVMNGFDVVEVGVGEVGAVVARVVVGSFAGFSE